MSPAVGSSHSAPRIIPAWDILTVRDAEMLLPPIGFSPAPSPCSLNPPVPLDHDTTASSCGSRQTALGITRFKQPGNKSQLNTVDRLHPHCWQFGPQKGGHKGAGLGLRGISLPLSTLTPTSELLRAWEHQEASSSAPWGSGDSRQGAIHLQKGDGEKPHPLPLGHC